MFEKMSKEKRAFVFFIALSEVVGAVSGLLSMMGMKNFVDFAQSELTPPGFVFPVVWALLYALMGVGAARIWLAEESVEQIKGLMIFGLQLIVNFFWSIIFFDFKAFQLAFWWLILLLVLITVMIYVYNKADKIAAVLQIPYFVWVVFAGYLTYMTWMLN